MGQTVSQSAALVALPVQQIYNKAQQLAASTGTAGGFVFDIATFTQRYEQDLSLTNAQAAANILQGQNLLQLVSSPLAAAIREARQRHAGGAQPLPNDVKAGLAAFFNSAVLNRARWTVGKIEITLPNGIGQTEKFGDRDYAVVADDIIVFNTQPPTFQDNPFWWGHEVTHVEQYTSLGVDEFARRYVFSGGADLENPANARGSQVLERARATGQATVVAAAITIPGTVPSQPLYPAKFQVTPSANVPATSSSSAVVDPPIIQCVFPYDPRPFAFLGTRSGRIIVVDSTNGEWMQIGFALPADIAGPAWRYSAGGVLYDVFPNGDIVQRWTQNGPQKIGYVVRLQ